MKIHSNAKLTPQGRQLLIDRVSRGMSVALACKSMGVSTTTGYKWLRRARDGEPLTDHSSRPHTMPRKTSPKVEEEVIKARIEKHLSPLNLERETGVPARTCARIVKRNECPKLADIDRVTGELIQHGPVTNERYEKDEPGEMIHMDVKKVAGIPDGGGWRATGVRNRESGRPAKSCLHVALDDNSRFAYVEQLLDEKKETVTGFTLRAISYFELLGVKVQRMYTDNGPAYHSTLLNETLDAMGIKHSYTKPYHPWTNGKVERFNRTLEQEWEYARAWTSEEERKEALQEFVNYYNNERPHSALQGQPPMSRIKK